ncbi:MAG: helix-turn-helix domain-containing protein [Thermoanaerobaculia bacterium]
MDRAQTVGHLGLSDRWLSVGEVCEYLGVSRDTVYRWVHNRQLPGRSVGRLWKFKKDEIDLWIAAGGVR